MIRRSAKAKRQAEQSSRLLLAIFVGVAALALAAAAFSTVWAVQRIGREKSVPGWVADQVVRSVKDAQTGAVTEYTYPVVEFSFPDQAPRRVEMAEGASPPDYALGAEVTVLYDPQQPQNLRIKSVASDLLLWILPGITFLVGAAFLAAALVVYKVWPPD